MSIEIIEHGERIYVIEKSVNRIVTLINRNIINSHTGERSYLQVGACYSINRELAGSIYLNRSACVRKINCALRVVPLRT